MQQCTCLSLEGKSTSSCWFVPLLLISLCFLENSAKGANMPLGNVHFDPILKMAS